MFLGIVVGSVNVMHGKDISNNEIQINPTTMETTSRAKPIALPEFSIIKKGKDKLEVSQTIDSDQGFPVLMYHSISNIGYRNRLVT